jgi:hypothetical protein
MPSRPAAPLGALFYLYAALIGIGTGISSSGQATGHCPLCCSAPCRLTSHQRAGSGLRGLGSVLRITHHTTAYRIRRGPGTTRPRNPQKRKRPPASGMAAAVVVAAAAAGPSPTHRSPVIPRGPAVRTAPGSPLYVIWHMVFAVRWFAVRWWVACYPRHPAPGKREDLGRLGR